MELYKIEKKGCYNYKWDVMRLSEYWISVSVAAPLEPLQSIQTESYISSQQLMDLREYVVIYLKMQLILCK